MTERFKFWQATQMSQKNVQQWEMRVRHSGNLCQYSNLTDEMCRDKFVFGIDPTICTELLKSHLTQEKTQKL